MGNFLSNIGLPGILIIVVLSIWLVSRVLRKAKSKSFKTESRETKQSRGLLAGGFAMGVIAVVSLYFGYSAYMNGSSGVSKSSSCNEMRATMRKAEAALKKTPDNRDLVKATANLNKVYADICL